MTSSRQDPAQNRIHPGARTTTVVDVNGVERRIRKRHPVLWRGRLYQRGELFDCVVRNFSATGAALMVEVQLAGTQIDFGRGAIVTLTIGRFGDFPGQVAWQTDNLIGIAFMRDPEEVELLIETLRHPANPQG